MIHLGIVGRASFYGPRYAARAAKRPNVTIEAVVPGATDEQLRAERAADEGDSVAIEERY